MRTTTTTMKMASKRHFENIQNSLLQPHEQPPHVKRERATDFWDNFIEDQKVWREGNASGMTLKKTEDSVREEALWGSTEEMDVTEVSDESMMEILKEESIESQYDEHEEDPLMPVEQEEKDPLKMPADDHESKCETKFQTQSLMSNVAQIRTQDPQPTGSSLPKTKFSLIGSELPLVDPLRPEANTFSETPVKQEESDPLEMAADNHKSQCETDLQIQSFTSFAAQIHTQDFQLPGSEHEINTQDFQLPGSEPEINTQDFQLPESEPGIHTQDFQLPGSEPELSLVDPLRPVADRFSETSSFSSEKRLNIPAMHSKNPFSDQLHPSATTSADLISEKCPIQSGPSEILPNLNTKMCKTTPKPSITCLLNNILTKPRQSFIDSNKLDAMENSVEHVCCAINTLLIHKFTGGEWSDEQKLQIVYKDGRPIPKFKGRTNDYLKIRWLSGCRKLKKFVCWYCLLFSTEGVWSISYNNKNFAKEADEHEVSMTHSENEVRFFNWKKGNRHHWKQTDSSLFLRLLTTEFLLWDDTERTNLLKVGKPYPTFKETQKYLKRQSYNRGAVCRPADHFECFKTISWLTGCVVINSTFCWPCLLFSPACAKLGIPLYKDRDSTEFEPLSTGAKEHEKQKLHLKAYLRLRVREQELKETTGLPTEPYERMMKNRMLMKYFIETVCTRKKQISNHVKTNEEYETISRLISTYDESLKAFYSDFGPILTGVNYELPGTVLSSIGHTLMTEIKKQVHDSKYISCIIDSTSLPNREFQVIVRYVDTKGDVRERFVALLRMKHRNDFTPGALIKKINSILIDKLDVRKEKVIGFTYDAAFLEPNNIITFNKHMRTNYPKAKFFHYRAHSWNVLLQQSLAQLQYCTDFIRDLVQLAQFSSKEISTMGEHSPDSWDSAEGFVVKLRQHFAKVLKFLDTMVFQSGLVKVKSVNLAKYFQEFLRPLHTRFLVALIAKIYEIIKPLSKELENEWAPGGNGLIVADAHRCIVKLNELPAEFEDLYQIACDMLPPTQSSGSYQIPKSKLRSQCSAIVEHVTKFIRNRDAETEKDCFRANQLLMRQTTSTDRDSWKYKMNLAWWPLEPIDHENFIAQLDFLHNDQHFCVNVSSIKLLYENNMEDVTPELYRFLQFVYTIPMKVSEDRSGNLGAVERMKKYVLNNRSVEFLDALMWMERDLLNCLQGKNKFYETVIDHLAHGPLVGGILAELKIAGGREG